ncbi:Hydroxyneurosporene methyltransferase [Rhodovulum sp. PH10]|nr:Hydroxyneurosporene methyltransferase [Rhodovulum sp. PH10]
MDAAPHSVKRPSGLAERWFALRNRMLASARFQRLAAAFPPTRALARRRTRALFDLVAGFVYSQILLACVRLKVFDLLADGPQEVDALAARTGLSPDAMRRLLEAAATLDLTERRGPDRFGLGIHGAALRGAGGLAEMIEHHTLLYADLADPVALLADREKETALSRFWAYARDPRPGTLPDAQVGAYSQLMAATQAFVAHEVFSAVKLGRRRCLLDVGGGEGAFLAAAGARFPKLSLMLFDLPAVVGRAEARLAAAGLADRAAVFGGDFRTDALPPGADTISFVRVLHDHDDATVLALLKAARQALPPDGIVVVAEPMSDVPGGEPAGEAYFGFYLWAMKSGRPRPPEALYALLTAAGFARPRLQPTKNPILLQVVVAEVDGSSRI